MVTSYFSTLYLIRDVKAAGIASKFLEHPFDLTKVRLQAQVLDASARFKGPLDCLSQTFKKEGIRGLYRVRLALHCLLPNSPGATGSVELRLCQAAISVPESSVPSLYTSDGPGQSCELGRTQS